MSVTAKHLTIDSTEVETQYAQRSKYASNVNVGTSSSGYLTTVASNAAGDQKLNVTPISYNESMVMLLHLGKYDTYTYSNGVYNISRYTGNNSGKNYTSTDTTSSGRATYMYGNDICNSDYAKLILNVDFEARGTGYWWNVTDLDDTKWYISYVAADSTIVIIPPVGETPNDVSFWYKKSACFNEVYNTGYYHKY